MKLRDLKAGDTVFADDGFPCLRSGHHIVQQDDAGLFITCDNGHHYLSGQEDAVGGDLVGLSDGLDPRTTQEQRTDHAHIKS